jgi:hypothetical protein
MQPRPQEDAMIVHKQGRKTVSAYAGFGQYRTIYTPLCAGPKGVWSGKRYYIHRLWAAVTCKHCLEKRNKKD